MNELYFFVLISLITTIVFYLINKKTGDPPWIYLVAGIVISILIEGFLSVLIGFMLIINLNGIEVKEKLPIYNICENGNTTEYYTKMTVDKDFIINFGDVQKVVGYIDEVVTGYNGIPYIEKTTILPDESEFPNNVIVNITKVIVNRLYIDKIE